MDEKLKNDEELEWSSVVANNSMNRKRKAFGINSYEREIKLDPIKYLISKYKDDKLNWIDLCCGEGNTIIQSAEFIRENGHENKVNLEGIDLVNYFSDYSDYEDLLELRQMNLNKWEPTKKYDLITIVHGLHYIGDKIALLQKLSNSLKSGGKFIGNLSLDNIKIVGIKDSDRMLKKIFRNSEILYNARSKIITLTNPFSILDNFEYLGANDNAGANYTGQEVVDSIYRLIK